MSNTTTARIVAHIIPANGETNDDTMARVLGHLHERTVVDNPHWQRLGAALSVHMDVTAHPGELRDVLDRLGASGAYATVRARRAA